MKGLRIEIKSTKDEEQPALGAFFYWPEDYVGVDFANGEKMRPDYLGGLQIYLGRREVEISLHRDVRGL